MVWLKFIISHDFAMDMVTATLSAACAAVAKAASKMLANFIFVVRPCESGRTWSDLEKWRERKSETD